MQGSPRRGPIVALLVSCLVFPATVDADDAAYGAGDWFCVGGDRGCMRYSSMDQIHRGNVSTLEVAWEYHTGELDALTIECTPVVVDGAMYITTGHLKVVALDAADGRPLWEFDPFESGPPDVPLASGGVNRGVAYWSDGKPDGQRRIIHGSAGGRLFSLDARTGKLDPAFGEAGVVDLRQGLGRDISRLPYGPTSAPAIYRNTAILGNSSGEGPGAVAPGDVRAFDVRTGRQIWRFHTVPRPGEFGNDTWEPGSWKDRGGANAWGGASVDEERGMVFVGLGSATFDLYGGDRKGQNLFANSVVALDARTGERVWHFQTLHHDLWDLDLPVYPNLVTVAHGGRRIDAVAQVTKTGYVFLFDRATGDPLFEIQERAVPESDVPGEQASPTQPVPLMPPPISPQFFGEQDLTDISEEARAHALQRYGKLRAGPAFIPPSLEGSLVTGWIGGASWSGASFDPTTGLLYVNSNNLPRVLRVETNPPEASFPYSFSGGFFRDREGYPAVKPPWGLLTAIDLNRGEFAWQVVLGSYPELTARGIRPTGTENLGGTIVTAGGLVFIGGTRDARFRAFDKATGEVLWEHSLPAGGYATPSTYMVNGRQYVVIAAGGGGNMRTEVGDAFVAFALP